jgi:hypothetical protein
MPGDCAVIDLHHDLFYTYRGPGTDADRDRQLENNVTKAKVSRNPRPF